LGALDVGAIKLRLGLKITRGSAGFSGTLDSLDQGAKDIPFSSIRYEKPNVVMELATVAAKFTGVLAENGSKMSGKWNQGGQSFPVVFERVEKPVTLNRPQEPKKPYPYREELMTCTNSKAGVKLAGTLTLPQQGDHFPAVVLITGSGAQDRDESLLGHKPFLVLSDYLTRRGIAVLRLDDRGVGGSTGDLMKSSDEDLAGDILCAVSWLKQRSDIDTKRIGLIGHSEGGVIAPIAAMQDPGIAFIVLMAGPGVPMEELLQKQAADLARVSGASDDLISRVRQFQRRCFDILKHQSDDVLAEKALQKVRDEAIKNSTVEEQKTLGLMSVNRQFKMMTSPWFRKILSSDPKPVLRKTHCAVLALNGERDLQVSAKENLAGIAAALKAGGNSNFKTVELPGLNHLFQHCKTGSPIEYGEIEETISPTALQLMGDWIRER
jgi:pimeloyl-ACP methyl ester carboxylesterase